LTPVDISTTQGASEGAPQGEDIPQDFVQTLADIPKESPKKIYAPIAIGQAALLSMRGLERPQSLSRQ
jgi:hypothetical protein